MLKAVIIDDEYIVISGLKSVVEWGKFGIEIVGEAIDGISGYEIIEKCRPDIILTDIRMPGMDGISLIEKAKEFLSDAFFVIFSGYREFEYVKKAISIGVLDYIEKPVTVEKVENVLRKIKKIHESRLDFLQMKRKLDETESGIIEKTLLNMLKGGNIQEEALAEITEKYDVNLLGIRDLIVCMGQMDEENGDMDLQYAEIRDIFEDNLNSIDLKCFVLREAGTFVLVVLGKGCLAGSGSTFRMLQDCRRKCEESRYHINLGVGKNYNSIYKLVNSYVEAKKALKYAVFLDDLQIVRIEQVEYNVSIPSTIDESEDSIVFNMRIGKKEKVLEQIRELLSNLKVYNLSPDIFRHACIEIITLGIKVLREAGKSADMEKWTEFIPYREIEDLYSFESISNRLLTVYEEIMDSMLEIRKTSNHKSILKAREYIDNNYSGEITLCRLAETANMNPTYFSMVFKDEIGITYVKYLTKIRMEKAKILLKQGHKVSDVARKVGYMSCRYFCDTFKKIHKMTPEQFKGS